MLIIRYRIVPQDTPDPDPPITGDKTLAEATAFMWGLRAVANGGVRWATDFVLAMGEEDGESVPPGRGE